ncbi:ChbG/HpnK family deacetylase [Piscinibacter gummiphilus]|uniref:ChbG/HpnK family deacetylase n=1 Tax=Piscinibacter gummiphilus TaxID=946333 RepID=A0ABZ0CZ99_9BURK|nr:ChbG/HpnK family deacetylase [Piscinibacter gummiphilus]WOB10238.1 ChbG/HpnK family deacetylase [Piscinibacter gummiphilus]
MPGHQPDHHPQVHRRRRTAHGDEPTETAPVSHVSSELHGAPSIGSAAAAAKRRRIAVCVDDFGLYPGIATAAVHLAAHGRISSVSCMTGAPAWQVGRPALRQLQALGVELGLHLDLSSHPLDARLRGSLPHWLFRAGTGTVDVNLLRREIQAQLERFEAMTGGAPDYVDGHQHLHQLPGVRTTLVDVLRERYPGRLPWLRSTRAAAAGAGHKARVIERLGNAGLSTLARRYGLAQNAHLLGVYDFSGEPDRYLTLLAGWLAGAGDGDLLVCHPSSDAAPGDPIGPARRREFEVLRSAPFDRLLKDAGLSVVPLRDMA